MPTVFSPRTVNHEWSSNKSWRYIRKKLIWLWRKNNNKSRMSPSMKADIFNPLLNSESFYWRKVTFIFFCPILLLLSQQYWMRFSINPHQSRVDQKWHSPLCKQQTSYFTHLNLCRHSRFSTEKNYGSIYVKNWCQCSGKPFTVAITLNEHAVGIRAKAKRAKVASIVQIYTNLQ